MTQNNRRSRKQPVLPAPIEVDRLNIDFCNFVSRLDEFACRVGRGPAGPFRDFIQQSVLNTALVASQVRQSLIKLRADVEMVEQAASGPTPSHEEMN